MCDYIAIFYLYTVALGRVGGVGKNFFQGGQLPQKLSKTMWLYMKNIP